ncbi:hypothetical protein F5Y11DRAFT_320684 [Daldinia sp. FL1419]|nr:hypothetical protein F5Y11DRAFT_320684 [Daldinia sp. FL1419]
MHITIYIYILAYVCISYNPLCLASNVHVRHIRCSSHPAYPSHRIQYIMTEIAAMPAPQATLHSTVQHCTALHIAQKKKKRKEEKKRKNKGSEIRGLFAWLARKLGHWRRMSPRSYRGASNECCRGSHLLATVSGLGCKLAILSYMQAARALEKHG